MPRQSRREAVAQRTRERLEQQRQRRQEAAQRGAQTRRERRVAEAAQARPEPEVERPTQGNVRRRSGQRVHPEMLTVAIRGPLAAKMRGLAESTGMTLAKLLGDMVLVYEGELQAAEDDQDIRAAACLDGPGRRWASRPMDIPLDPWSTPMGCLRPGGGTQGEVRKGQGFRREAGNVMNGRRPT